MSAIYKDLKPYECSKCNALCWRGVVAGCTVIVSRYTIPARDADVLARYGTHVVISVWVDMSNTLKADFYSGPDTESFHRKFIAVQHVCSLDNDKARKVRYSGKTPPGIPIRKRTRVTQTTEPPF